MSEELDPVLNMDHTNKGNNKLGSSKFAHHEDDAEMSEELEAVLNVNDLVAGGSTIKHEQSKFKNIEMEESDSNSAQEDEDQIEMDM